MEKLLEVPVGGLCFVTHRTHRIRSYGNDKRRDWFPTTSKRASARLELPKEVCFFVESRADAENLKYELWRIDKECHRPVVLESIRERCTAQLLFHTCFYIRISGLTLFNFQDLPEFFNIHLHSLYTCCIYIAHENIIIT